MQPYILILFQLVGLLWAQSKPGKWDVPQQAMPPHLGYEEPLPPLPNGPFEGTLYYAVYESADSIPSFRVFELNQIQPTYLSILRVKGNQRLSTTYKLKEPQSHQLENVENSELYIDDGTDSLVYYPPIPDTSYQPHKPAIYEPQPSDVVRFGLYCHEVTAIDTLNKGWRIQYWAPDGPRLNLLARNYGQTPITRLMGTYALVSLSKVDLVVSSRYYLSVLYKVVPEKLPASLFTPPKKPRREMSN